MAPNQNPVDFDEWPQFRHTRLRRVSDGQRTMQGCALSFGCLVLAVIVPFWPVSAPVFLLLSLVLPFMAAWLPAWRGVCPKCGCGLEVYSRNHRVRCGRCGEQLLTSGGKLWEV